MRFKKKKTLRYVKKAKFLVYKNNNRDIDDPRYIEWRNKVLRRDGACCQWPGCKYKKTLQIHHVLPWAQYPSLRFQPENGITLCRRHHKQIERNELAWVPLFLLIIQTNQKNNDKEDNGTC